MTHQEVQLLRRRVVKQLAELTACAEILYPPSLASRNVVFHAERLCDCMDAMLSGRDELPLGVDDFPGW